MGVDGDKFLNSLILRLPPVQDLETTDTVDYDLQDVVVVVVHINSFDHSYLGGLLLMHGCGRSEYQLEFVISHTVGNTQGDGHQLLTHHRRYRAPVHSAHLEDFTSLLGIVINVGQISQQFPGILLVSDIFFLRLLLNPDYRQQGLWPGTFRQPEVMIDTPLPYSVRRL